MKALMIIGSAILLAILLQLLIWMVRSYIRDKKNLCESRSKSGHEYKSNEVNSPIRIGEPARSTDVLALVELLKDQDEEVRANAVYALAEIGEPAVPALIKAMSDEEVEVREYAVGTLGLIGKSSKEAVPTVIEVLKDVGEDLWVRRNAAYALGNIGHPAAVPVLVRILADKEEDERTRQFHTSISRESSIAPFRFNPITGQWSALIEEAEAGIREYAAMALCVIGEPAVPTLIEALRDADGWVRQKAASALGAIGEPVAVPALIEALKDEDEKVREWAVVSLGQIGNPALPALTEVLSETNMVVRDQVIDALIRIGTPEAMKTLKGYAPGDLP